MDTKDMADEIRLIALALEQCCDPHGPRPAMTLATQLREIRARLLAAREGGGGWVTVTDDPGTWPQGDDAILAEWDHPRFGVQRERMFASTVRGPHPQIGLRWMRWPTSRPTPAGCPTCEGLEGLLTEDCYRLHILKANKGDAYCIEAIDSRKNAVQAYEGPSLQAAISAAVKGDA